MFSATKVNSVVCISVHAPVEIECDKGIQVVNKSGRKPVELQKVNIPQYMLMFEVSLISALKNIGLWLSS